MDSYFLAQTSLTTRNHTLSRNTELSCLEKLTETVSMHHIATELNISSTTVLRILHSYGNSVKPHYKWLPAVINMDEIKSTRDVKGAMSFVFMDGMKRQFTDILESRTLSILNE